MSVDILMAAYNGEKYIEAQINSVLNQSYTDWHLYIRDDASTDKRADIIKRYADKYPEKISISVNEKNSGSPAANFYALISASTADYVMTCDQDDIWHSNKIEKTLKLMQKEDNTLPLLAHTDLTVTDEDMNTLHTSMINTQHIDVSKTKLKNLIVQNCVTGCTMCLNRALINKIRFSENIPVHDWWLACSAVLFGKIVFLPESTINYRQHGKNTCGAKDMQSAAYLAERVKNKSHSKSMLILSYTMAEELLQKYDDDISETDRKMLTQYADSKNANKAKRLFVIAKYGIWKSGVIRKLGQIWLT
jgi:glycosyltransferase involved in cell wall biosynthesis